MAWPCKRTWPQLSNDLSFFSGPKSNRATGAGLRGVADFISDVISGFFLPWFIDFIMILAAIPTSIPSHKMSQFCLFQDRISMNFPSLGMHIHGIMPIDSHFQSDKNPIDSIKTSHPQHQGGRGGGARSREITSLIIDFVDGWEWDNVAKWWLMMVNDGDNNG